MACCQPPVSFQHHPFCKNNVYVAPTEPTMFTHTADATTYSIFSADGIMNWVLKNLGHIMAINGRPLAVTASHVIDSLTACSNVVTSHMGNTLTGFAILTTESLTMKNKFREMVGETIVANKNSEVYVDAVVVSVVYAVPGQGCDLIGFLRTMTPSKRVLALEAVKGSEKFYKRIGMSKYGEDTKHKTDLFVCSSYDFFIPYPAIEFKQRSKTPLVDPFPAGFGDHMLGLVNKSLDELCAITGCPSPLVPAERKSISIFHVMDTCKKCGNELCVCDFHDMDFPLDAVIDKGIDKGAGALPDFSFAAAEAYGAKLKREAAESAAAAEAFASLFASTEAARTTLEHSEAAATASKQRAEAAHKAAEVAAEAARKAHEEEGQLCAAHAAAMAASSAALKSLEAAVSRKRARSP